MRSIRPVLIPVTLTLALTAPTVLTVPTAPVDTPQLTSVPVLIPGTAVPERAVSKSRPSATAISACRNSETALVPMGRDIPLNPACSV